MYDVLEGVTVLELAEHTFVPAAGVVLADWGADVVKIEHTEHGGDASRKMQTLSQPGASRNAFFEVANRGKRGITLNLKLPEGLEQFLRLVTKADVLTTSLREDALARLGITPQKLFWHNPRLIYARGSGPGRRGPLAAQGGFDFPTSWCRSGSGFVQTPADGGRPPQQPGSVGDLTGGATLAGAISAALFRRERTSKGGLVDHSLYAMGTYIMTQSITRASLAGDAGKDVPASARKPAVSDPLVRLYRTGDGRWLSLCLLKDSWWPDLAEALDIAQLAEDPRFSDSRSRFTHAAELIEILDDVFSAHTLQEWCRTLEKIQGVWSPLLNPAEVLEDEQALQNGYVTAVTPGDGETYMSSATPAQFDQKPVGELRAAPTYSEHTEEVFAEFGLDRSEIAALRMRGVIV